MIPAPRVKHFLITPFYVRRRFGAGEPNLAATEWLDRRMVLFERYCLPSVLGQSHRDFEWLLYLDESTPDRHLRRLESLTGHASNVTILLCPLWEPSSIARQLSARSSATTEWIITSRLDNDDALHRDFVRIVQGSAEERTEYLNFPQGVILYDGKCFLYRHPSNAFISLVEPAAAPRTVWTTAHERASEVAPVRQLWSTPSFLQVVHGGNVSNKPRGMRIPVKRAQQGFEAVPAMMTLPVRETAIGIAFEHLTRGTIWRLRDLLISMVKYVHRRWNKTRGSNSAV